MIDPLVLDSSLWSLVIVLFIVPLGLLALNLSWKNPGIVFGLFLAIPFYKAAVDALLPVDITGLLWALLLLPVAQLLLRPEEYRLRYSVVLTWMVVLLVVVTSIILSLLAGAFPDKGEPLSYLANYILLLWIPGFAAFRVVGEERSRRQMLLTLAAIGSLTILVGLLSLGTLGELERLRPLGANTIGTARSALWTPLILIPLYWHRKTLRLPLILLALAAFLVAVSSGSRGPVLFATMAGVAIVLIQTKRTRFVFNLMALLVTFPVLAFLFTLDFVKQVIPEQSLSRIEMFISGVLGVASNAAVEWDSSASTRFELWKFSWQMFSENPIIGQGAGSFGYYAERMGLPGFHDGPHNLWFQFIAELGLIGFLVFGGVLVFAGLRMFTQPVYPDFIAISALFTFRLFETIVGSGVNDRQSWLIFAMMLAIPLLGKNGSQNVEQTYSQSRILAEEGLFVSSHSFCSSNLKR